MNIRDLCEKLFNDDKQNSNQEHHDGNLVDAMHHSQIEVAFAVGVVFAEEITEHRTQLEIFFQSTHGLGRIRIGL
jgi:hypothetical protein